MKALYYTRDHLGSIRELVDMQGAVRARYDYDPYGRMTKVSGDRDSQFLYTGHYWHAQSGLYLAPFRAYDPDLGRWISRDPSGEGNGNDLYAYVNNSPIRFMDPSGLSGYDVTQEGWLHSLDSTGTSIFGFYKDVFTGNVTKNADMRYNQGPLGQAEHLSNPCSNDWLDRMANGLVTLPKGKEFGTLEFVGRQVDLAEGGGFNGVLHEYDSEYGHSVNELTEGWVGGEGGNVGVGKITGTAGNPMSGWFVFGGGSLSAGPLAGSQIGVAVGDGWIAFYWEGHRGLVTGGGGAYVRTGAH